MFYITQAEEAGKERKKEKTYKEFYKNMVDKWETNYKFQEDKNKIVLDPGIGFGKTYEQNLEVLKRLGELKTLGYPILLGTSRKSVIGNTLDLPPQERVEGTIATTVLGIRDGVDIVRVHDVEKNLRAAKMADAIYRG